MITHVNACTCILHCSLVLAFCTVHLYSHSMNVISQYRTLVYACDIAHLRAQHTVAQLLPAHICWQIYRCTKSIVCIHTCTHAQRSQVCTQTCMHSHVCTPVFARVHGLVRAPTLVCTVISTRAHVRTESRSKSRTGLSKVHVNDLKPSVGKLLTAHMALNSGKTKSIIRPYVSPASPAKASGGHR